MIKLPFSVAKFFQFIEASSRGSSSNMGSNGVFDIRPAMNANHPKLAWGQIERKLKFKDRDPEDLLLPNVPRDQKIRFVCISDTHSFHDPIQLPEGDVLLHCGDFSQMGRTSEITRFNDWLGELNFEHKLVIAGNHDMGLDNTMNNHGTKPQKRTILSNCIYLEDESYTVHGYKIYGSPWVPRFGFWGFMKTRDEMEEICNMIPDDTEILMTHGPPLGILDLCRSGDLAGCFHLLNTVMNRLNVTYHLFGNIHEDYGIKRCLNHPSQTTFVNASTCTIRYSPDNSPVVFELPKKT